MKKLRLTVKSLELINQGVTSNRTLGELMAALTAEQRETVHAAFGYLAQASRQFHVSHNRKDEQHASDA
jgi:transcriptional regulator of NAD metabolism